MEALELVRDTEPLLPGWYSPGDLPGASGEEPACQRRGRRRHGLSHWVEKIPGAGNGYPLQYCLENPMHRGAWRATVRGVTELDTSKQQTHIPGLSSDQLPRSDCLCLCSSVSEILPHPLSASSFYSCFNGGLDFALEYRCCLVAKWCWTLFQP